MKMYNTKCKEVPTANCAWQRLKTAMLVATAVVVGAADAGQVINQPENGWSKQDVKLRFGEPGSVQGPVGNPAVTRWDYAQFSVFFENDVVLVAVTDDVGVESADQVQSQVVAQASPTTPVTVPADTSSTARASGKDQPDSLLVQAAGNFGNRAPARATPVAYTPEPVVSQPSVSLKDVPSNGQRMADVASRHGQPSRIDAAVGNPPITVWHYQGFSVYFEHELVLVATPQDGYVIEPRPGILVDAASEADATVDSSSQ